jgi:hypothetical protein
LGQGFFAAAPVQGLFEMLCQGAKKFRLVGFKKNKKKNDARNAAAGIFPRDF